MHCELLATTIATGCRQARVSPSAAVLLASLFGTLLPKVGAAPGFLQGDEAVRTRVQAPRAPWCCRSPRLPVHACLLKCFLGSAFYGKSVISVGSISVSRSSLKRLPNYKIGLTCRSMGVAHAPLNTALKLLSPTGTRVPTGIGFFP